MCTTHSTISQAMGGTVGSIVRWQGARAFKFFLSLGTLCGAAVTAIF